MIEVQHLFSTLQQRGVTFSSRIAVSPMCEYSSQDGFANDWHFVHLGSRAVGGAALVLTEAAAVTPEGRITPADLGLWSDAHVPGLHRIVHFLHEQGARRGSARTRRAKGEHSEAMGGRQDGPARARRLE